MGRPSQTDTAARSLNSTVNPENAPGAGHKQSYPGQSRPQSSRHIAGFERRVTSTGTVSSRPSGRATSLPCTITSNGESRGSGIFAVLRSDAGSRMIAMTSSGRRERLRTAITVLIPLGWRESVPAGRRPRPRRGACRPSGQSSISSSGVRQRIHDPGDARARLVTVTGKGPELVELSPMPERRSSGAYPVTGFSRWLRGSGGPGSLAPGNWCRARPTPAAEAVGQAWTPRDQ